MIASFESFWALLEKENPIWWEQCNMRFYKKDIKKCAQDCHVYILADEKLFKQLTECDGAALRKYFTSWLMKAPDAPQAPRLQQVEEPKVDTGWKPTTPERRERWLKVLAWRIDKTKNNFSVPKISTRQAMEEGGWTPKKDQPYKSDDDIFLIKLKDNVRRFASRKYKSLYSWSGFSNYDLGLIQVYAQNATDAQHFYKCAERLTRMQLNVKKKKRVNLV